MRLRRALGLALCGPIVGLALYCALGHNRSAADAAARAGMRATLATLVDETGDAGRDVEQAYLHVLRLQSATPPGEARAATDRDALAAAEAAYNRRQAAWDARLADPELRATVLVDAHRSAAAFFRLVHEQFLPRLDRGRPEATDRLLNSSLADAYDTYRSVQGQAADALRERSEAADRAAGDAEADARGGRLVAAIAVGAATTAAVTAVAGLRRLCRPLQAVAAAPAQDATFDRDPPVTTAPQAGFAAGPPELDDLDWAAMLLAAGVTAGPEPAHRDEDGPQPVPLVTAPGH
jgi:hypothetical protein